MTRLDGESYLAYAKRLTLAVEDGLLGYKEYGDYLLGDENVYGSENIRKFFYLFKKVVNRIDDSIGYQSDDLIKEFEQSKNELYKERCRLQDQRRELNKLLREESRFEYLVEVLKDCVLESDKVEFPKYNLPVQDTNYAILQLSDWHCGKVSDNPFNYYDVDTMIERANIIVEKTIQKCKKDNVGSLVVEINGDMVEGEINISGKVASEEDTVDQITIVSKVLSECIKKLAPNFNDIKIVTTLGNHGRLNSNKKDVMTKENFEKLIPLLIRLETGLPVHSSNGLDFTRYTIEDKIIYLSHGQHDKLGKAVSDFSKMYKEIPDEVHLGHFHEYKDTSECDVFTTVNGSLCGTDDYSLTLRKVSKPSQNLIIYDGVDRCIYNLIAE